MASVVAALSLEQETHLLKLLPEPAQLHLLYKGSHHGFNMHTLRSKFDKEGRFVVIVYFNSGDVKGGYLSKSSNESEDQDAFAFEINHQEVTHFPVLDDSKATHFSTSMSNGCLTFGDCLKLYTENISICVESWDIMYHQGCWREPEYLDVELYRVGSKYNFYSSINFCHYCTVICRDYALIHFIFKVHGGSCHGLRSRSHCELIYGVQHSLTLSSLLLL